MLSPGTEARIYTAGGAIGIAVVIFGLVQVSAFLAAVFWKAFVWWSKVLG